MLEYARDVLSDQVTDSHRQITDIANDALDMPRTAAAATKISRRVSSPMSCERFKSQSASVVRSNTLLSGGSGKHSNARNFFSKVSKEAVSSGVDELSQRHCSSKIVQ